MIKYLFLVTVLSLLSCASKFDRGDLVVHKLTGDTFIVVDNMLSTSIAVRANNYFIYYMDESECTIINTDAITTNTEGKIFYSEESAVWQDTASIEYSGVHDSVFYKRIVFKSTLFIDSVKGYKVDTLLPCSPVPMYEEKHRD